MMQRACFTAANKSPTLGAISKIETRATPRVQCSAASVSSSSFESEARHSIQICCPAAGLRSWQVRLILQGDLMELHLQRGSFSPHVATTIGYPPGEVHLSHEKKSRIVQGDPCGQGQPFVDIAIRVVL